MMGLPDEIDNVWMAVQRSRLRLETEVVLRGANDHAFLIATMVLDAGTCLSHLMGSEDAIYNLELVIQTLRERERIPPPADTPETTP